MLSQLVRGPLLVPHPGGAVDYHPDGVLAADADGVLLYAGSWSGLRCQLGDDVPPVRPADGVMLPPFLDLHTHVPQHPIRGHFVDGVADDAPGGKLLAGLNRNVFPTEAKCHDQAHAERVTRGFAADTLAHGVVGGAAYMTVSAAATEAALNVLPAAWSVGMVLMNQNCPLDLRTNEPALEADHERLAARFGQRVIVTDRFAVAVDSPLRRRAAALAGRLGLRTQTHLNEQMAEKSFVETGLYPNAGSYTDVYRRDGLLAHRCILAHCIQMRPDEWAIVHETGSVVAHCPTSNLLLGSGVMPLDEVLDRGIPYAIATDVGASPTVSLLAEMKRFLTVHAGRSTRATPTEALYRTTLAPAEILGLDGQFGRLAAGRPMSFVEVARAEPAAGVAGGVTADDIIRSLLPADVDRPAAAVRRVTINGKTVSH
ncbi:MAG: amidohydrolase [Phycisphaerales bacterium]|nr:amidohydrolase [Phycisphaerales bacterium]